MEHFTQYDAECLIESIHTKIGELILVLGLDLEKNKDAEIIINELNMLVGDIKGYTIPPT